MRKVFLLYVLLFGCAASAQTPWPSVRIDSYPHIDKMQLVRHEQSILLGEGDQQTGLFFSRLQDVYSEQVERQLVADASKKGWKLHSSMRFGTSYVIVFSRQQRLLDIRLTNKGDAVEAAYSVLLSQANMMLPVVALVDVVTTPPAVPSQVESPAPINIR